MRGSNSVRHGKLKVEHAAHYCVKAAVQWPVIKLIKPQSTNENRGALTRLRWRFGEKVRTRLLYLGMYVQTGEIVPICQTPP